MNVSRRTILSYLAELAGQAPNKPLLGGPEGWLSARRVLALAHIHNAGAAFSMLTGARWFFVVLTVALVVFALWVLYAKKITHPFGRWTLALIIAGALGNLIDRALNGYVVDMFEVLFMNFAIFNVADIFVVVGGIGFCIYFGFLHDKLKAKEKREEHHDDPV